MKSSFLVNSALVLAAVTIAGAAVLATRPDVRNDLDYRINSDHIAAPDVTSEVPTIPPSVPSSIRIAAAGDVGTGEDAELRTAAAMDRLESGFEYAALLLLGDNVYPNGDPAQLHRAVFDPFATVLDGDTRLLPVLGNHDVLDDNGDAHAAAIGMPGRWYATSIGDVLILSLDSTRPDDQAQLTWLETTLADSTATWTIATMHHPPYSGGYHGSSLDVREAFTPLFERYGVQLVLAGHDHDYQRSEPLGGVTYVVSGGAAKLRPANRAEFTEVAWSTYHFLDLAVWPDRMEIRAIDQNGDVFDSVTLQP